MKTHVANGTNGGWDGYSCPSPSPALTRIEIQLPADPFLLNKFEDFYAEVVRLKAALVGLPRDAGSSPYSSPQIRQSLLSLLNNQRAEVERVETLLGVEMYRQVQHVMACLADDVFSALFDARGSTWNSLEAELFGARERGGFSPGSPCLQKIDQLILQDDPVYRELASVYFYALALRGPGHNDTEKYLGPLFEMISTGPPAGSAGQSPLFAQAYAHTLAENKVVLLPSPKKWLLVLASIVLAWIGLSSFLWLEISGPVARQLYEIQSLTKR
jgi:hypothetical protein